MRNKRNLIQEIKRINSINLGKEIITEQEGPILDLITALVRRGSNDKQTQSLITKVSETQATGKRISLLSQLRKSQDIEISRLVKSIDNDILQELETIIPRLTNNKSVQTRIIQDIQNGVSKEDSIKNILTQFQRTYGDYANDFVNKFSSSVGKTYDNILAKINPPTPPKPEPDKPEPDKPDPNKPEPPIPSPTDYISIIRKFFRDLLSKKPELQTNLKTFQISASEKVNRIKALVEEYAQPKMDGVRLKEISKEIRKIMVELGQEDKELVGVIELEIKNGLNNSPKAERKNWELLDAAMKDIKERGGDFTYIENIASPLSDFWVTIREGIKYGLAQERNFFIVSASNISGWFPRMSNFITALRKIQGVDVKELGLVLSPFDGGMNIAVTSTFPGSMRGIPAGAPRQEIIKVGEIVKSKKDLPSGYQAIYDLQKNSKTKAWASLAIEKITKVIKWQVYFSVLNALKSWVLFLYQSDEELQMEYRDCIKQVGDAMERGDISLDEAPNPEKIPSCLVEIEMGDQEVFNFPGSSYLNSLTFGYLGRDSYTKQELIQAILIRAYLQRGAEDDEWALGIYNFFIQPMIEPLTKLTLTEAGLGFFFGYAPAWAYEIATNYVPKTWSRIVTGGTTGVDEALENIRTQAETAASELEETTGLEIPVQIEETEYVGPDFDQ
jgi:hypothetical protein